MKIHYDLQHISEFGGWDPRHFIVGAFVTCPFNQALKLALMAFADLGVQDFGDP